MSNEQDMRSRAKDHLPSVLLTLLSIVQALALQLLWEHVAADAELYVLDWDAMLCWLQISATLFGVMIVWLIYTNLALRFRWVPSTADSVFPFVVGVLEYLLIGALGVEKIGRWLLVLALIFAVMAAITQVTMRRARLDGENEEFFATIARASLLDYDGASLRAVALAVLGVYLLISGNRGWPALLALLFACAMLGYQFWLSDRYWRRSLGMP